MNPAEAEALRRASALVYVEDLEGLTLDDQTAHHLARVLRLRAGEAVVASDGLGAYRHCQVISSNPTGSRSAGVALEAVAALGYEEPPERTVTVAFALQKGDRADWAVQKLTELGVDRILPLLSERTIVRLEGTERHRRGEHLRKVAREAGAQSRRVRLPAVEDPAQFSELVGTFGGSARIAEQGGAASFVGCDTVVVGPEGGWSEAELSCGLEAVALGEGVLRSETAAVVAGTLLCALRGGVVAASPGLSRSPLVVQ